MLRRIQTTYDSNNGAMFRDVLRAGVTALKDPSVEGRVREYFEKNPGYSRDAAHVAVRETKVEILFSSLFLAPTSDGRQTSSAMFSD